MIMNHATPDTPLPRPRLLLEAGLVTLLIAAFYWTHLDLTRMQSGGDFANLFWPMKELRLQVLREAGVFLLWNPYLFLGSPAAATMQHAIFYPIDYLFFWRSPTLAALNFYILFHSILAGCGAWFWMRFALRCGGMGSILAGFAFPCTAWFWGAQEHINQIAAVAWMPWLLAIALLFAKGRISSRHFVLAYSSLSALQLLVGHPQAAFYTHVTSAALIALNVAVRPGGTRFSALVRTFFPFLVAGVLAAALSAVQLLLTMELSPLASRHLIDPAWPFSYSMPPDVLGTYFRPHLFGSYIDGYLDRRAYNEYGLFVGLPVLILAAAAIGYAFLRFAKTRHLDRTVLSCLLLVIVTLLIAMGGNASPARLLSAEFTEFPAPAFGDAGQGFGHLSLHEIIVRLIPPAQSFRVPARVVVITALAWVTLGGLGLAHLVQSLKTRRPESAALPVVLGGVVIVSVWASLYLPTREEKFRHPVESAPLLLAWAEDAGLRPLRSIDRRLYRLTTSDHDILIAGREQGTETTGGVNSVWLRWMRWTPNDNAVIALPSVQGYEEGLAPTFRTKDFLFALNRNLRQGRPDRQLLRLLGVGTIFSDLPIDESMYPRDGRLSSGPRAVYSVPGASPAAFWTRQAEGLDLNRLEGPHWPERGLLPRGSDLPVDFGTADQWDSDLPPLTTDVTNPNRVVVKRIDRPPGDALLVMAWFPGWEIDGRPAEWINAIHVRIPVESFKEGSAVLSYRPPAYRIGLFFSLLGVCLWIAVLRTKPQPAAREGEAIDPPSRAGDLPASEGA